MSPDNHNKQHRPLHFENICCFSPSGKGKHSIGVIEEKTADAITNKYKSPNNNKYSNETLIVRPFG